jgi:hypothetical protein
MTTNRFKRLTRDRGRLVQAPASASRVPVCSAKDVYREGLAGSPAVPTLLASILQR